MDDPKKHDLDCQVAEKVMGWTKYEFEKEGSTHVEWVRPDRGIVQDFHPSTDIAAAWKVVERMRDLWTAWTEKLSANREAAIKKYDRMSDEEKMRYMGDVYDQVAAEMAGPRPFSDEAFFNRLHRKIDRRWPWAFFYLDPVLICEAAVAAFPPVPHEMNKR